METSISNDDVPVVKDEDNERPIPTAWRRTFREIAKRFANRDYQLKSPVPNVAPVSETTATQIEQYVHDYGETLVELSDETWKSSVCIWMGNRWDVLIDLWTSGEGRSDLVLSVKVVEANDGFEFKIEMVYVP